jgi:hypothetical protein
LQVIFLRERAAEVAYGGGHYHRVRWLESAEANIRRVLPAEELLGVRYIPNMLQAISRNEDRFLMLCNIRSCSLYHFNSNFSFQPSRQTRWEHSKSSNKCLLSSLRSNPPHFRQLRIHPFQVPCFRLLSKGCYSPHQLCWHRYSPGLFRFFSLRHIHNGYAENSRYGSVKLLGWEQPDVQANINVLQLPSQTETTERSGSHAGKAVRKTHSETFERTRKSRGLSRFRATPDGASSCPTDVKWRARWKNEHVFRTSAREPSNAFGRCWTASRWI